MGKRLGSSGCRDCGTARGCLSVSALHGNGLGLAASLHFAAGIGAGGYFEHDANPNPLRTELGALGLNIREGEVSVPSGPSIGWEPDANAQKELAIHSVECNEMDGNANPKWRRCDLWGGLRERPASSRHRDGLGPRHSLRGRARRREGHQCRDTRGADRRRDRGPEGVDRRAGCTVQLRWHRRPWHHIRLRRSVLDARARSQRHLHVSNDPEVPARDDRSGRRVDHQHGLCCILGDRRAEPLCLRHDQGCGDRHDQGGGRRPHLCRYPLQSHLPGTVESPSLQDPCGPRVTTRRPTPRS